LGFFQTIEWEDPEVEMLRNAVEALRSELNKIKEKLDSLRAQLRARKYVMYEVVYLRLKIQKIYL